METHEATHPISQSSTQKPKRTGRYRNIFAVFAIFCCYAASLTAFASVDQCLSKVDALSQQADSRGFISNTRTVSAVIKHCEQAEQTAPNSVSVKLALTRSLIWAGRNDAAFVRLEQIIDEDEASADLAAMLCASSQSSARVLTKSCDWVVDYGGSNSELLYTSAREMLNRGDVERYLSLLELATTANQPQAVRESAEICSQFDTNNPSAISNNYPIFANTDPIYIAAVACSSVFTTNQPNSSNWREFGLKSATALLYYNDYEGIGNILLILANSTDAATLAEATAISEHLCMELAADPKDPAANGAGVELADILVEKAQPICEVAAYINPLNSTLHYNLSRIYELQEDADNHYAALDEATRLGHILAHPFDPTKYSASDLIAALYHGDRDSIYLLAPENHSLTKVFLGEKFNLFLIAYLQAFINATLSGKEDFFCESYDVHFTGKSLHALQKMQFEMSEQMLGNIVVAITDPQRTDQFFNDSMSALFKNGDLSAMYNEWKTTKLDLAAASSYGQRDGDIFVRQFTCGEAARPLVENIDAFIEGRDLPHKDLFYLSKYDPNSGSKTLYDACGEALVKAQVEQVPASRTCHCVVQELYNDEYSDDEFFDTAQIFFQQNVANLPPTMSNILNKCSY